MDLDLDSLGSTTFKREDFQRGFEPDSCFYIQNEGRVRGKTEIDPYADPPPDLVIEVDITGPSLPRFPIYARFGVPEVWRYDGERAVIYGLRGTGYVELSESAALPIPTSADLSGFVNDGATVRRRVWMRQLREWVQGRIGASD